GLTRTRMEIAAMPIQYRPAFEKFPAMAARFDARGGPEKAFKLMFGDQYEHTPTKKGEYVVARCGQHVSKRYRWSGIPWGSRMRRDPNGHELQVCLHGQWRFVKDVIGVDREQVERYVYETLFGPAKNHLNDHGIKVSFSNRR